MVHDDRLTWAVALYAGRELPALAAAPERLGNLYWTTAGFFPELLTRFVHGLYADYSHRITPLDEIEAMAAQGGRPSALLRVDTEAMRIADAHAAPTGTIIASPQFVARGEAPLDGWILATVYTPERAELWCYDAARLAAGPLCRLDASPLGIGFSLHTAWLPELSPRTASYRIDLATDTAGRGDEHEGVEALLARSARASAGAERRDGRGRAPARSRIMMPVGGRRHFAVSVATLLWVAGCASPGDRAWRDAAERWNERDPAAFASWQALDAETGPGRRAHAALAQADAEYRRGIALLVRRRRRRRARAPRAGRARAPIDPALYLPLARACHRRGLDERARRCTTSSSPSRPPAPTPRPPVASCARSATTSARSSRRRARGAAAWPWWPLPVGAGVALAAAALVWAAPAPHLAGRARRRQPRAAAGHRLPRRLLAARAAQAPHPRRRRRRPRHRRAARSARASGALSSPDCTAASRWPSPSPATSAPF